MFQNLNSIPTHKSLNMFNSLYSFENKDVHIDLMGLKKHLFQLSHMWISLLNKVESGRS
jgi:hypothetical protein